MMTLFSIFIFLLLIIGIVALSNLSPDAFTSEVMNLIAPDDTIKGKIKQAQTKKKQNIIIKNIADVRNLLAYMHQSNKFVIVCIASILLSIGGVIISISVGNPFLTVPFCIGFCAFPFIFVRLYSYTYSKRIQRELETTLSTITTSYIRTNNLTRAFEENLDQISPLILKPFQEFVAQIHYINPNQKQAIEDLSTKIDDDIFKEWCDGLKKCAKNSTLQYLLVPIVNKYATLRSITSEIEADMQAIKLQFIIILCIVYGNIPLLYVLNIDWYNSLFTFIGKATIGLIATISVISIILVVYLTKPLKYRV